MRRWACWGGRAWPRSGPRTWDPRAGAGWGGTAARRWWPPGRPSREISFTAARRAVIASVQAGAATASLPASLTTANRDRRLASLARRRITVDRNRHRDRKTKARPGFPAGGTLPAHPTAVAEISICGTLAA